MDINLVTVVIGVVLATWCSQEAKAVGRNQLAWMFAAIPIYAVPRMVVFRVAVLLIGSDCASTVRYPWVVSTLAAVGAVVWVRNRYLIESTTSGRTNGSSGPA